MGLHHSIPQEKGNILRELLSLHKKHNVPLQARPETSPASVFKLLWLHSTSCRMYIVLLHTSSKTTAMYKTLQECGEALNT
jgi:hypothetical protein